MQFRNAPIRSKLMAITLGTSAVVLLLTCAAFVTYDLLTFRRASARQLATLGEVIATNSTAVLAFENSDDATEVLRALQAERHIVAAALYDKRGRLFARYPAGAMEEVFPTQPGADGYRFGDGVLEGFAPVVQVKGNRLGTLYLRSDLEAMHARLRLYAGIAALIAAVLSVVAYGLSRRLQQQISRPILALAETARKVSNESDYSVRAQKLGEDELGLLTDAFNRMLEQIEAQNLALQRAKDELEGRVRERTAELERANKGLEAFAYSVSHDLRTPLRAVIGLSDVLRRQAADQLTPDAQRCLALIQRGTREMDELIDRILAFSRMGHDVVSHDTVDLALLTRETYADLEGEQRGRTIELRIGEMPPVRGDGALLRHVLVNLLSNALKFTRPRAKPVIEVGALEMPDGTGHVYFVRDNGVGFDPRDADRLFGVFQRLHHPREFEGSGVGLAMVRRIIERHGGTIWAEGRPDAGATIYFRLPAG